MLDNWPKRIWVAAFLCVLIGLSFAIGYASHHQQQKNPPGQELSNKSDSEQDKSNASRSDAATAQINCDPNCAAKHANEDRNETYIQRIVRKTLEDPLAILTGVLAVATFFLVGGVLIQLRDARISSERQLRAYLTTVVGGCFRQGKNLFFEFRPIILNTGQTPAYEVTVISDIQFLSLKEAETYDFRRPASAGVSVMTLGPRQDRFTHVILGRKLSKAELREYWKGDQKLYVFGTLRYRDAFRKRRYTNYCYVVGAWNKRGGPLWHTANRHTDSD